MKKRCIGKCKELLIVNNDNFHKNKQKKDGYSNRCKKCELERKREKNKMKKKYELVGYNDIDELFC